MNTRYTLFVQDSVSKRFLQVAASIEALKATKSTIQRWSNEQGHPQPEKGAQLLIEHSGGGVASTAVFGASRLRWTDTPSAVAACRAATRVASKSIFGG